MEREIEKKIERKRERESRMILEIVANGSGDEG